MPQEICAVSLIGQKFRKREERCCGRLFDKSPKRIAEDVFEAWSPRVRPKRFEDAHDV